MPTNDPLETLLIDPVVTVRAKLASALTRRVGLDRERRQVHLLSRDGSVRARVLLTLLGAKALDMLSDNGDGDGALKPQEVANASGIAPGSVRPALVEMLAERLVGKNASGAYFVPTAMLDTAIMEGTTVRAVEVAA